jgi:hypothetical protein
MKLILIQSRLVAQPAVVAVAALQVDPNKVEAAVELDSATVWAAQRRVPVVLHSIISNFGGSKSNRWKAWSVRTVEQLPLRYGDVMIKGIQSAMHVASTTSFTRSIVLSV